MSNDLLSKGFSIFGVPVEDAAGGNIVSGLIERYSEPHRCYHGLNHLKDVLEKADRFSVHTTKPELVKIALWYHDAIYRLDPSFDSQRASASLAVNELKDLLSGRDLYEVKHMIIATRMDVHKLTRDEALVSEIDLSILGEPPQIYDAYAKGIRQEWVVNAGVPEKDFNFTRASFMEKFLKKPIFTIDRFYQLYEIQARENIQREIEKLRANSSP